MSRQTFITFGKYSGKPIEDLPSSYLMWLIETFENTDKHQDIIEAVIEEHNYREHYGHFE